MKIWILINGFSKVLQCFINKKRARIPTTNETISERGLCPNAAILANPYTRPKNVNMIKMIPGISTGTFCGSCFSSIVLIPRINVKSKTGIKITKI